MFASIALNVLGLIFLSLITIFYFTKKRHNDIENYIFSVLTIATVCLLVLEIVCIFTMATRNLYPLLNEITCRLYILGVMFWVGTVIVYLRTIGKNIKYAKNTDIFKDRFVVGNIIFGVITFTLSCFFPLTFTSGVNDELYVIAGSGVYVLYVVFIFLDTYMLFLLLKYKSSTSFFKKLPIFLFLLLFIISLIIQFIYMDINDLTYLFAFCVISIYFTLENPDIKLVKELEEANRLAEMANKEKNEFLARMSHEIRTPLNSIMGFSESVMISDNNINENIIKDDAKNINLAGNNLLEIIDNILDISKIESGKEKINNSEYSIKDIVYELISYTDSKLIDGETKFIVDLDNNIPEVLIGDKLILFRILQGLISNAIKFTKSGQIKLIINSKKENKGVNLFIDISDTGIGIKDEDCDKLFSKFSKLSQDGGVDNSNGTGLGLAIVKELVELISGEITVNSTYGVGTTFHIKLINNYKGDNTIGNFEIVKRDRSLNNYSKYSVLIVDDNEINIQILTNLLNLYSLKVDSCKSGLGAIDNIKNNMTYDLIFMDYIMPEMDGIETFSILKRMNDYTIPPVIVTTNNDKERDICLKEGFNDYIEKPFDNKTLRKLLNKYLDKEGDE